MDLHAVPEVDLDELLARASSAIAAAGSVDELQRMSAELLGKRSALSEAKKQLGALDPDARREWGARLNDARVRVEQLLDERRGELAAAERRARLEAERLDLTEIRE